MDAETTQRGSGDAAGEPVVVRRSEQGWQVGSEETADLTSAMVLADLLAADLGPPAASTSGPPAASTSGPPAASTSGPPAASTSGPPTAPPSGPLAAQAGPSAVTGRAQGVEADEAARLAVTVAQLEHALSARVRVEQAIGVLAERHRLRPRQAFDLLRNVARSSGQKVTEIAGAVVDSTSNPLLPLPEELARKQLAPRRRGRSPRHARSGENVGGGR
jgi:hypothetical protein